MKIEFDNSIRRLRLSFLCCANRHQNCLEKSLQNNCLTLFLKPNHILYNTYSSEKMLQHFTAQQQDWLHTVQVILSFHILYVYISPAVLKYLTIRSFEPYIVLEFLTIPLGQNGSRQDNMVQKKIIFPDLLTMASVRWIKQKATQTPVRKEKKTCEKLMILIEKSKIMEK